MGNQLFYLYHFLHLTHVITFFAPSLEREFLTIRPPLPLPRPPIHFPNAIIGHKARKMDFLSVLSITDALHGLIQESPSSRAEIYQKPPLR